LTKILKDGVGIYMVGKDGGFIKKGNLKKIFNKKMLKVFGTIPKIYDFFIFYFLFSKISPLFSIFGFFLLFYI
jgi:hypothetical protein